MFNLDMSRVLQKRLFFLQVLVAFMIFGSVWWMYGKCFRYKLQEKITETNSNYDNIEYYESYPVNIRYIHAEVKVKVNDIENIEDYNLDRRHIHEDVKSNLSDIEIIEDYQLDSKHLTESNPEGLERYLHTTYDPHRTFIEKLKGMLKGDDLSRDVEFEEDFLRAYITSNNFNIDKAFNKIINFLNLKIEHDELFHNISFDYTQYSGYRFITLLPRRSKDGAATLLFEIAKWDPEHVPLIHLKRMLFMMYMQELRNPLTQANGINSIYDFKDVGYKYMKFASPENLYLLNHVAHEVIPVKFVGIHLININFLAKLLITLIRPFLPAFIEKIFYVHSSLEDLLRFFPISMLPAQYGGHLTDFYAADWIRKANEQHDNYPAGGQKNVF